MENPYKEGSTKQFKNLWNLRPESRYIHWSPNKPDNQIRLAFKNHYKLFNSLENEKSLNKNFIELGAGRGSLSAYYSQNGYDVTLLDTSDEILNRAKDIFKFYKLSAKFLKANAAKTNIQSGTFSVVASIGLLEHFEDPWDLFQESIRIAKPNADIFFYVVPDNVINIQKIFDVFNKFLKFFGSSKLNKKEEVFRNNYTIDYYLKILNKIKNIKDISGFGVYPLPMISPNREFPFTLNNKFVELLITKVFSLILLFRRIIYRKNPWICREENGQAFVLHFRKIDDK